MAKIITLTANDNDGEEIFPVTKTKAIYDEATGARLDSIIPNMLVNGTGDIVTEPAKLDADTLGGEYTADDITELNNSLSDVAFNKFVATYKGLTICFERYSNIVIMSIIGTTTSDIGIWEKVSDFPIFAKSPDVSIYVDDFQINNNSLIQTSNAIGSGTYKNCHMILLPQ